MEEDPEKPQAHRLKFMTNRWWRKDFNSNVPEWMKEAKWVNSLFIASMVGVLLDPLFFYIPFIGEENKCIGMDTKLRNAALILRLLTDMPSLLPALPVIASLLSVIALLFYDHYVASELMLAIVTVIYQCPVQIGAFLPIPQVAILIGFYRRGFGNLHFSIILNVLLLFQYAVRVYRIHYLSKDLLNSRKLTKGAFNLFLFILSGNVLGAMLYFFSIQREALCWHQACRDAPGCTATFYCGDTNATASTNTTFLNELCPVNSPNATVFDFGIYLNPLQSGNTGRVKFTTKLFYFFWWGIKNLSNFGTNLDTSSYVWENCFAILICLIGLLIFLYLIGNIQTYMQMQTAKEEALKELLPKTVKKRELIISWLDRHIKHNRALAKLTVRAFDKMVNENSHIGDVDVDVDVRYILSIGDRALRNRLQRELMTDALKNLRTLGRNSAAMYTFCEHLEPVVYTKNSYVVREGEPIDLMIFILDGTVWTYATSDDTNYAGESRIMSTAVPRTTIIKKLGKGDFYGEELLSFALPENSFSHLPISTKNVKCRTEIEALVLTVDNWRDALQKFKYMWGIKICGGSEEVEEDGLRQNMRYIKLEKDALEWATRIKESSGPEDT